MCNTNEATLAKALNEVGYERISTPPSQHSIQVQCRWCRCHLTESLNDESVSNIRQRVIHDTDCPVDLAKQILAKPTKRLSDIQAEIK